MPRDGSTALLADDPSAARDSATGPLRCRHPADCAFSLLLCRSHGGWGRASPRPAPVLSVGPRPALEIATGDDGSDVLRTDGPAAMLWFLLLWTLFAAFVACGLGRVITSPRQPPP